MCGKESHYNYNMACRKCKILEILGRRNVIDAQKSGGGVAGKSDLWRDMWLASAILVLRV